MEALRLGEVVLRSSQPLLPFLAPSLYRNPQSRRTSAAVASSFARHCQSSRSQCLASRAFGVSTRHRAGDTGNRTDNTPAFPSAPPTSKDSVNESVASLLDSAMDFSKGTSTAPKSRSSRFSSRDAQNRNSPSRGLGNIPDTQRPDSGSSMDDLIASMTAGFRPSRRQGPSTYDSIEKMLDPQGKSLSGPPASGLTERVQVRLGPTAGRTVRVDASRGQDFARALRSLELLCARNQVRRQFTAQRFHERPGLKRKRLKSIRWRASFKRGFQAVLAKVQKMKKQGW